MLDAPSNNTESTDEYAYQICVSWPYKEGFLGSTEPLDFPTTNEQRHQLIHKLAETWAEPFRKFVQELPRETEIKQLEVHDYVPARNMHTSGRTLLMGDALHAMAMCT